MRRTLAVGILACFLLSIIPAISDSPVIIEKVVEVALSVEALPEIFLVGFLGAHSSAIS